MNPQLNPFHTKLLHHFTSAYLSTISSSFHIISISSPPYLITTLPHHLTSSLPHHTYLSTTSSLPHHHLTSLPHLPSSLHIISTSPHLTSPHLTSPPHYLTTTLSLYHIPPLHLTSSLPLPTLPPHLTSPHLPLYHISPPHFTSSLPLHLTSPPHISQQIFLNGITYCEMFPPEHNSLSVAGMAGGRLYECVLEVFPLDAMFLPHRSNKLVSEINVFTFLTIFLKHSICQFKFFFADSMYLCVILTLLFLYFYSTLILTQR